jgi:SAM-dependent methyltransferase
MTTGVLEHNQRAAAVWSSGGKDYDRVSHSIADALEHCVRRLDPQPNERVLDLATGTGWTSRIVARCGASVVGVDIAEGLLDSARERASVEGLAIDYRVGDAERLPFADGQFDAVISSFGVMFASRPEVAAAELARVCRKGGRVALTTWLPDSNVFQMFMVMKEYMPPPPVPAPPSPFAWGSAQRLRELLGQDFDLKFEPGTTVMRESSGEAAWNMLSVGYGPTKMLAAGLDEMRRAALHRDFVAFHDGFCTDLGIAVPRTYLVTVGTRR